MKYIGFTREKLHFLGFRISNQYNHQFLFYIQANFHVMTLFFISWKYWILGVLIQMTMAAIRIVHEPAAKQVKLGENATLSCIFDTSALRCYWAMGGDVVETEGRYQFVGNRERGNCTLKIYDFQLADIGLWQCGLPKTDTTAGIKSKLVKISASQLLSPFHTETSSGVSFRRNPRNVDILPGQSITLPCSLNTDASSCYWLKDGHVKMLRKNNTLRGYVGQTSRGECALTIAKVSLEDDGLWQCVYENVTTNIVLQSSIARLKVLAPSKRPYIAVNGTAVANGSSLYILSMADITRISCIAEDGNPEAHLSLMLGDRKLNGSAIYYVTNSAVPKLKTSEIELREKIDPTWHYQELSCVASHPAFSSFNETTHVLILFPEPTASVNVWIRGSDELTVEARTDQDVTIICLANGIPPPKYKWLTRHRENGEWLWFHNGQNVTFKAMAGEYSCLAWNDLSEGNVTRSKEVIFIIISIKTTHVDVWFQETKLENPNVTTGNLNNATLRCLANGRTDPVLRWEVWRDDHWERVQDGHSITLPSGKGKYSCVAWNIKDENSTVRSMDIFVNENELFVVDAGLHLPPTAVLVGAVVACVALLTVVCAVVIVCQRRKGGISIERLHKPNPKVTFY